MGKPRGTYRNLTLLIIKTYFIWNRTRVIVVLLQCSLLLHHNQAWVRIFISADIIVAPLCSSCDYRRQRTIWWGLSCEGSSCSRSKLFADWETGFIGDRYTTRNEDEKNACIVCLLFLSSSTPLIFVMYDDAGVLYVEKCIKKFQNIYRLWAYILIGAANYRWEVTNTIYPPVMRVDVFKLILVSCRFNATTSFKCCR